MGVESRSLPVMRIADSVGSGQTRIEASCETAQRSRTNVITGIVILLLVIACGCGLDSPGSGQGSVIMVMNIRAPKKDG
jgi:hypothetical protein